MQSIRESGFRFRYLELINEMLRSLDTLSVFRKYDNKEEMIQMIREKLEEKSAELKAIQEKLNQEEFSIMDYEKIIKSFSFQRLTKEFFEQLSIVIEEKINTTISLDDLDDLDYDLTSFCREQGLTEIRHSSRVIIDNPEEYNDNDYISAEVLGENERDERFDRKTFNKMLSAVEDASDDIVEDSNKAELIIRGSKKFELYFKNVKLKGDAFKSKTLAIIDDLTKTDLDLFITCDGLVPVKHSKVDGLRRFEKVEYQGKSIKLGWPDEYSNRAVNLGNLYSLIERLDAIRKQ